MNQKLKVAMLVALVLYFVTPAQFEAIHSGLHQFVERACQVLEVAKLKFTSVTA